MPPRKPKAVPAPISPPAAESIPGEERQEEETRLQKTVLFIDDALLSLKGRRRPGGGSIDLAVASVKNTAELIYQLEQARPSPYFGRVDFRPTAKRVRESHYIGKYHVPDHVSSWTAPVAALYYKPAAKGYKAPEGYIAGTIELKREFEISATEIKAMADLVRLLPGGEVAGAAAALPSGTLGKALASGGGGAMYEAIQTIQPEQYEEIAAGDKPVMVLQGAAGSGKSLVGLHRIAYLLSPFSEMGRMSRPRPNRVIMFGPSAAFLAYVSALLPSLGHRDIRQTTLRAWMLATFTQPVQVEPADKLLVALMERGHPPTDAAMNAERFKGSSHMAEVLDKHVRALRRDFQRNAKPVSVRAPSGDPVVLDAPEVTKLVADGPSLPLNEGRSRLIEQIFQAVLTKGQFREDIELRSRLRTSMAPSVRAAVERFWPVVDFRRAYARLLAKESASIALGVMPDVARQLALNAPREEGPFTANDLPPLLYLDHLLNTIQTQAFEHIVVDEAQDVSPLEVILLQKHSANGSFTIMGDIRQRLLPYRGIRDWRDLSGLFRVDDTSNCDSNTSYRSTEQITAFANKVLRQILGSATPANTFPRQGEEPQPIPAADLPTMLRNIALDVRRLQEKGAATIGVLTRSAQDAAAISDFLKRQGGTNTQLLKAADVVTGGLTVTPILLTKGLEFDAVVLAGINRENFTGSDFDTRLLYLGCTRAKHWLHLHWSGLASPSLAFGKG